MRELQPDESRALLAGGQVAHIAVIAECPVRWIRSMFRRAIVVPGKDTGRRRISRCVKDEDAARGDKGR